MTIEVSTHLSDLPSLYSTQSMTLAAAQGKARCLAAWPERAYTTPASDRSALGIVAELNGVQESPCCGLRIHSPRRVRKHGSSASSSDLGLIVDVPDVFDVVSIEADARSDTAVS